jgi:hypothetical protein
MQFCTIELSNFIIYCFDNPQLLTPAVFEDMCAIGALLSQSKIQHYLWEAWDWVIPGPGPVGRYYESMSASIALDVPMHTPEMFDAWIKWIETAIEHSSQPGLCNTHEQALGWRRLANRLGKENALLIAEGAPLGQWSQLLESHEMAATLDGQTAAAASEERSTRL